ncbi:hypothetical protein [Vibrio parahaemolyticus]|uniref:hypothetical protein n=1 Tax=Vibrio parahaemolyticus TaxID=670 RepID=UPI001C58B467|nr:hypothetical protein [Vibrio parahaemolyticus]
MPEKNTKETSIKTYLEWTGLIALLLSSCGLANQYYILNEFGVSLSDFADLDDFLVGFINLLLSLKYASQFEVIVAVVYLVIFAFFSWYWNDRKKKTRSQEPSNKVYINIFRKHGSFISVIVFFIVCILLSILVGRNQVQEISNGEVCPIDVQLRHPNSGFNKIHKDSLLYPITGLNAAYFVLEAKLTSKENEKDKIEHVSVHSLPYSNISQISILCTGKASSD